MDESKNKEHICTEKHVRVQTYQGELEFPQLKRKGHLESIKEVSPSNKKEVSPSNYKGRVT